MTRYKIYKDDWWFVWWIAGSKPIAAFPTWDEARDFLIKCGW